MDGSLIDKLKANPIRSIRPAEPHSISHGRFISARKHSVITDNSENRSKGLLSGAVHVGGIIAPPTQHFLLATQGVSHAEWPGDNETATSAGSIWYGIEIE
jgi:hypothetical protein